MNKTGISSRHSITDKKRIPYYDYLRIFAAFAVIVIHVSARYSIDFPAAGVDFYVFCGDFFRWCVPVFVMISGALFLGPKHSIKTIYTKNILRIAVAYLFWSVIYAFFNNPSKRIDMSFFGTVLEGPGHLWFLFMIIGLYMVVPILRRLVESKKDTVYFLLLSFIFTFLIQRLLTGYSILFGREASIITAKMSALDLHIPLGYSGYFVLGYYLSSNNLSRKVKNVIYILFFIAISQTVFFSLFNNGNNIIKTSFKADYLSPTVLIESIAVFTFARDHLNRGGKTVGVLSNCTFGIYLVHILVMNFMFDTIGIERVFGSSPFLVFPVSIAVFLISVFISWLINKIPVVNKYIV